MRCKSCDTPLQYPLDHDFELCRVCLWQSKQTYNILYDHDYQWGQLEPDRLDNPRYMKN